MDFIKESILVQCLIICFLFFMKLHTCSSVMYKSNKRIYSHNTPNKHLNNSDRVTQSETDRNVSLTKVHSSSQKARTVDGNKLPRTENVMTLDYETDMSSPDQTYPDTSFPERNDEVVENKADGKRSTLFYEHDNVTKDAEDVSDNDATTIRNTTEVNESDASVLHNTTNTDDSNAEVTSNSTSKSHSRATLKRITHATKDIPSPTKTSATEIKYQGVDRLKASAEDRNNSEQMITLKESTVTKTPVDPQSSSSSNSSICSACNKTADELSSSKRNSITPITPNVSEISTPSSKFQEDSTTKSEPHEETSETGDYDVTIFGAGEEGMSKDCPTCGNRGLTEDDVKELRLNAFAGVLRKKLRLYNRDFTQVEEPAEKILPKLPEVVKEQTFKDDRVVEEKFEFYARDEEIIITGADIGHDCIKMNANSTGCYTFDLKGNRVKRGIDSAFLWFYKTKDRHDFHKHELLLYELGLRKRMSGRLKEKSILARSELYIKDGWVSMDLTIPVRKWVEQSGDKKILAIKCNTCATKHYKALYGVKEGYKPVLVIKYLKPKNDRREKRESVTCDPRTECCKRPLVVDFDTINLHHIIRPKSMSIGFCYGFCDSLDQLTYNHTAVKQRMRWAHNEDSSLREQLRSCCVPVLLKDASIITNEGGAIVRKMLPNIIVERCGCM